MTQQISKQKVFVSANNTKLCSTLKPQLIQNYLLIWVDASINQTDSYCQNVLAQLREVLSTIIIYSDPTQFINFLSNVVDEKVFLILSIDFVEQFIAQIHEMQQLDSIYILCNNNAKYKRWIRQWPKLEGIYSSMESICNSLKKVAYQCDHNTIAMSFIAKESKSDVVSENVPSSQGIELNKFGSLYKYVMLLKDLILEMDDVNDDTNPVQDLVNYCLERGFSKTELIEFQDQYAQKTSIWWYTNKTFLYSTLNHALRTLNIEVIIKARFFIRNLHRQLTELNQKQYAQVREKLTVYRGQGFSMDDFQNFRKLKYGLLVYHGFLSASKERHIAINYMKENRRKYENNVGVLFKMNIDQSKRSLLKTSYASVENYVPLNMEEDILFSMHTVFHFVDIQQSTEDASLWEIHLSIMDDNDSELNEIVKYMKNEITGIGWYRLGKLMHQLGDLNRAEQLYDLLLQTSSNDSDRSYIYHELGRVRGRQGKHEEAITLYDQCLDIKRKIVKDDDISSATAYDNLAQAYEHMGDYAKALTYHQKSIKIKEHVLPENHPDLAISYNKIGLVYSNINDYAKALDYHQKALTIDENVCTTIHPNLAVSCDNIATVYNNMGDYAKALEFYDRALEIWQNVLPATDPNLAASYNNIGSVYKNKGDHLKALQYYEKALEIDRKVHPPNYSDMATSYNNIGLVYHNMGDYTKALEFYEKALDIDEKALSSIHPDLATSYNNIASLYSDLNEYSKALEYYEKSIKIKQKLLPSTHLSLATTYNNIGTVYKHIGDYTQALEYYKRDLEITERALPPTHPDLAISYDNIATIYNDEGNYLKALEFYEKVLQIKEITLPTIHPSLAMTYSNIGMTYSNLGDHLKAYSFLEKALVIFQKSLLPTDSLIITVKTKIDDIRKKM